MPTLVCMFGFLTSYAYPGLQQIGDNMHDPDKEFLSAEDMIFKSEHKPIKRIYVDLEYMQDLRLGALLSMLKVKEEFGYVNHNLPKYNSRYDRQIGKYFKALKISDADITKRMHDPISCEKICVISPFTSIYYRLFTIVAAARTHLKAIEDHPTDIELVINCADVPYPEILQDRLCSTLAQQLAVAPRFTRTKRYSLPDNEYLTYDLLLLADYGEFIKQHASTLIGTGRYTDTRIVAQPYIEDEILSKAEDPEHLLDYTEKSLGVYCEFSYLRSEIWLDRQ